jgi:hypothetical protein
VGVIIPQPIEDSTHMTDLLRRFRGMGVALVVLAISAGAVFAGAPRFTPASDAVSETTETTSETTETTETSATTTVGDEDGDEGDEGDDATTTETSEAGDEADATDTHGDLVSTAAQLPTPEGFPNHGAFVSCVAKMGKDVLASTIVWADVTAESCGITPDATSEKTKGKSQQAKDKAQHGNGKAKGHGKPQG